MHQGLDGVVGDHVAIGVIGLQRLEDAHLTLTFLHVLAEDFQRLHCGRLVVKKVLAAFAQVVVFVPLGVFAFLAEIGLGDPYLQEFAAFDDLLHGVGGEGLELDVLDLALALVAFHVLRGVARNGVHIVHPPIGRHDLKLVLGRVVVDEAERQHDVEFTGVVGLAEQGKAGEFRRVLHAGAEARPEATRGHNLAVGGAAVVVGANGGTGSHVALSHDASRDEEGVVVMLLVRGEDEVVEHLAARDGGVVAQHRVDEAGAVFQVAVVAEHKAGGRHRVEDTAAVARDAVDEDDALADLRRLLLRRVDGEVLQLAGAFDVAVRSHLGILEDPAVLDDARLADGAVVAAVEVDAGLCDLLEAFLQLGVVGVFGPEVGVGRDHTIKGQDATRADLVHHLEPHAHVLGLAFLDGAVTELGVVGGGDLLDIKENGAVADDVVGHVMHVVDGHVVADVA